MLSDEDVLAAVRRRVEERGGTSPVSPGEAAVTRHLLIEGRVLRSLETRAEEERFHQGFIDLSDRPVYGSDLDSYRIPPPEDPAVETTLGLVRRGSVDDRPCHCGNGLVACGALPGDRRAAVRPGQGLRRVPGGRELPVVRRHRSPQPSDVRPAGRGAAGAGGPRQVRSVRHRELGVRRLRRTR
ncbi:hypothetical protein ACFQ9J_11390 [Streptomyces sp. NPDC056529]|uniref:hypothetical protein n=1 Tax=Streptomyces sp. NPDC056529 TaxID=3345855 RepID=UPI00369B03E2